MRDARGVPVCGLRQTAAFLRDPAAFTSGPGLALGALYRVPIPGRRFFVVTDPGIAEEILVRQAEAFEKGRIYWRTLQRIIGDSLGSLEGERWEYLHRVEGPFFSPRSVGGYLAAVAEQTTMHVDGLERLARMEQPVAMLETLSELNTRIVLAVLFGRERDPGAPELARRITDGHEIIDWAGRLPWRGVTIGLTSRGRRAAEHRRFFGRYVEGLVQARRGRSGPNLIDALADIRRDPAAPRYSDDVLRNEVMFHLGAAVETQAAAEGWALYLLARHPSTLDRVQAEVDACAGGAPVDESHLGALAHTRSVVQETLRLYPPVYGILRECVAPIELGSCTIKKGDAVLVSVYAMHRSPNVWEAPDSFLPSRFETDGAALDRHRYLPFGAGRHVCIGRHLAVPAMVLAIAQIAQRLSWSLVDAEIRPRPRPSLKPSGRLEARLTPRVPAAGPALR
jgi:cytochrome P450